MDISYSNYGLRANQVFNNKELKNKKEEEKTEEQGQQPTANNAGYEPVTASGADIIAKQNAVGIRGSEGGKGVTDPNGQLATLLHLWDLYQMIKQAFLEQYNSMTEMEKIAEISNMLSKISEIENHDLYNQLDPSIQASIESDKTNYLSNIHEMGINNDMMSKIAEYIAATNQLASLDPSDPGYQEVLTDSINALEEIMKDDTYSQMSASLQIEMQDAYIEQTEALMEAMNVNNSMRPLILNYENAKIQYYQESTANAGDPHRSLRNVINKFIELSNANGYSSLPASFRNKLEGEYLELSKTLDNLEKNWADGFVNSQMYNEPEEVYRILSEYSSDPDRASVYQFAFQNLGLGQRGQYFRSKVAKNQSVLNALLSITDPHYAGMVNPLRQKFNTLLTLSQNYLSHSGSSYKDFEANTSQSQVQS